MNILITSCGRRSYLIEYFKDALRQCGGGNVVAVNSTADTPCAKVADFFCTAPLIYDVNYIPFLLNLCKEKHIDALISLFDVDLPVLAENAEKFEKIGVKTVLSSRETIAICADKYKAYEFLTENNICCPTSFLNTTICMNEISAGTMKFPVIVKPRRGMGSISMYVADDEKELDILFAKCRKDIEKSYLKYEALSVKDQPVLISEMIEGEEFGLDIINDLDGNFVTVLAKKKLSMRAGETDAAITVGDSDLYDLGQKIAKLLRHRGCLDLDVIRRKDGKLYVIDMNARFGGGYPFSQNAGANIPLAIVKWIKGEAAESSLFEMKTGVKAIKDIAITSIGECQA